MTRTVAMVYLAVGVCEQCERHTRIALVRTSITARIWLCLECSVRTTEKLWLVDGKLQEVQSLHEANAWLTKRVMALERQLADTERLIKERA